MSKATNRWEAPTCASADEDHDENIGSVNFEPWISCDPQQCIVLVYWYTSSKTAVHGICEQQSTAFLEEVFGRSFLAGLPHRGVRFFQQVLI